MVQTKFLEKIETHFRFNDFFPPKFVSFMRWCGQIRYSWRGHWWQYTRWFKYDRDWFVCKQAALSSSCATLREWSHNLHPPSCSGYNLFNPVWELLEWWAIMVTKKKKISPGHIWTTLYYTVSTLITSLSRCLSERMRGPCDSSSVAIEIKVHMLHTVDTRSLCLHFRLIFLDGSDEHRKTIQKLYKYFEQRVPL